MRKKPVQWIQPAIKNFKVTWQGKCESMLTSPNMGFHEENGSITYPRCTSPAKVDFRGRKLCLVHAGRAALAELAGEIPGSHN